MSRDFIRKVDEATRRITVNEKGERSISEELVAVILDKFWTLFNQSKSVSEGKKQQIILEKILTFNNALFVQLFERDRHNFLSKILSASDMSAIDAVRRERKLGYISSSVALTTDTTPAANFLRDSIGKDQKTIYESMLTLPQAVISEIFQNKQYRDHLKSLLPDYNIWNIQDRYNKMHANENPSVKTRRYETDEGGLYQIELKKEDGPSLTINFTRNYALGSERILSADPIKMSADEWGMFVDRGHGLYATSMVTRTIATIGQYISEVERRYGLQPVKDAATGKYALSQSDMQMLYERDPNAYQKYKLILIAQDSLRDLYALERKVDPNHPESQRVFKHALQEVLHELREDLYQLQQLSIDRMHESSDHILAHAQKQVSNFEWPNDEHGRRFAITEADQLLVSRGQYVTYDASMEPSSAAGGSVYSSTRGFGKEGRDNFAHCITLLDDFDRTQRSAFLEEVKKLKPSEGLKIQATSQEERAREMESMRIALVVLDNAKGLIIPDVMSRMDELLSPYRTDIGDAICLKEFGCSAAEFERRVYFHVATHTTNAELKVEVVEVRKLREEEILAEKLEKLGTGPGAEEEYRFLVKKKDSVVKNFGSDVEVVRDARQKTLDAINKKLKAHLLREGDPREQLEKHAQVIGNYLSQDKFNTFDEVKKEMNRIISLYDENFCVQVFGASKSELEQVIIREAMLSDVKGSFSEGMARYSKESDQFGEIVVEAIRKKAEAIEQGFLVSSDKARLPDRVVSRKDNPILEAKAIEIAESAANKPNPIEFIVEQAKKRAPDQEKRVVAESLYRYALTCGAEKFAEIKDQLAQYVMPYHDVASIIKARDLLTAAQPARAAFEEAYQKKYQEFLPKALEKLSDTFTFQDAVRAAQTAALQESGVKAAKEEFDAKMAAVRPRDLKTDHEVGDVFLRTGVLGFLYKAVNPIFSVLEEMGAQDPMRGALALGVMGATMGFTMMAHGATVAAAAGQNAFMHFMATKTAGIVPAIYKNMLVLNSQSGGFKVFSAAMIDGVTLGKLTYLLTSSADMAATGSLTGFTGHIIAGIINNPLETAVLIGVMTVLGHGMILGMHEQADMGSGGWELAGGFFEALKVADVGYHAIKEIAMIVANGLAHSPEGLKDIPRVKLFFSEMFAQAICNKLSDSHKSDAELQGKLQKLFEEALKNVDITNPAELAAATGAFLLQLDKTNISKSIRDSIEITVSQETPNYGKLYQLMQEETAAVGPVVSPLQFLEKKYEREARAFSVGVDDQDAIHRQHKKDYLVGFFVQDLLTEKSKNSDAWKAIFKDPVLQNQVTAISGIPWVTLRDQPVPAYRTTAEKVADVLAAVAPSLKANAEGAGKLLVNAPLRVAGHVVSTITTGVVRAGTGVVQAVVADVDVLSGAATLNQAGERVASFVSGEVAKRTIAPPDNVSEWRREMTGAELVGKATSLKAEVSRQHFYFELVQMKDVGGFLKQAGELAKKAIKLDPSIETTDKFILAQELRNFLVSMFPKEVIDLNKQLDAKGIIDSTERNSYMLASLQKLCREEIMICSAAEIAALKKQPQLVEMLAGQKMDLDAVRNPVVELHDEIARKRDETKRTIHVAAVVMRRESLGKLDVAADYRFSKTLVAIDFAAEAKPSALKGAEVIGVLKAVCNKYHDMKSAFGIDSKLITRLSTVLKDLPRSMGTESADAVALHVLSKLFPVEALKLASVLLNRYDIKLENRDAVMLATLQNVLRAEILVAATKSKTAYYAFTDVFKQVANSGMKELLTGFGDFKTAEVEKAKVTNAKISSIFHSGNEKKDSPRADAGTAYKPPTLE